ncbi:hypothetical protein [Peribacillus asahii]|uniref:hypothetical protein n=1 Tax=Peribacillus asahii TaxID=228899 RepID=UPI00207A6499|nr:hypothetical protein [Peribacillus asahii]USK71781.1 hypothetical protein LIS76_08510 [Peribacillus asahii]
MKLKNYPYRLHTRRVISKFLNTKDAVDYLKERGICVHAFRKDDLAKIGADFYYSMDDFIKLKEKIDSPESYKNSSRINIPHEQLSELKEALISLSMQKIEDDEDTKVHVLSNPDGTWKFEIEYTEFKPSLIDLLDTTHRKIEVNVNDNPDSSSLDFNIINNHDYKKVNEVLAYVHKSSPEIEFNFSEISLSSLTKEKRIQLFNDFFQFDHASWELKKIMKLKVKRDKKQQEESALTKDQLEGINSAILDGQNLIKNSFVKSTIENSFYFSMATMRFDNVDTADFIDIVIDFKTRPERCETKITASGIYEEGANGPIETKLVLDALTQDSILFQFKNTLYQIFVELSQQETHEIEIAEDQINFLEDTATEKQVSAGLEEQDESKSTDESV